MKPASDHLIAYLQNDPSVADLRDLFDLDQMAEGRRAFVRDRNLEVYLKYPAQDLVMRDENSEGNVLELVYSSRAIRKDPVPAIASLLLSQNGFIEYLEQYAYENTKVYQHLYNSHPPEMFEGEPRDLAAKPRKRALLERIFSPVISRVKRGQLVRLRELEGGVSSLYLRRVYLEESARKGLQILTALSAEDELKDHPSLPVAIEKAHKITENYGRIARVDREIIDVFRRVHALYFPDAFKEHQRKLELKAKIDDELATLLCGGHH